MKKRCVATEAAPGAIGPYSQAVEVDGWVYLSGQIPIVPETGEFLGDADVATQAKQVMKNLRAVLNASGCDFSHVVKSTIFLMDLQDFAVVNEIYGEAFPAEPPARATVQVAGLPKGSKVEIDMIARKSSS